MFGDKGEKKMAENEEKKTKKSMKMMMSSFFKTRTEMR